MWVPQDMRQKAQIRRWVPWSGKKNTDVSCAQMIFHYPPKTEKASTYSYPSFKVCRGVDIIVGYLATAECGAVGAPFWGEPRLRETLRKHKSRTNGKWSNHLKRVLSGGLTTLTEKTASGCQEGKLDPDSGLL